MFDLFRKLDRIGSGGYADVYRAQNIFSKEYAARKELRVSSPENLRRFERERDMLKLYGGTGYFPKYIYDNLQASPPYIIMELSTFGSLEQFVGQPVDVKRCLRWLIDVAHAVEIIQRNNHKHRDIKPSNLLIYFRNGQERVGLSDFGIAQRPDTNGTKTNSPLGTKEYLDPIALRDNFFYPQSDVFALGKTMRELLTGFREPSIFRQIPGPASVTALINSMTSEDIYSRPSPQVIYQAAENILRDIETAEREAMQAKQAQAEQSSGGGLWLLGLAAAALAYATSNSYDSKVDRFRDNNGKFRPGRWG